MSTVVIIHGSYGSPQENWFPWLARKAEDAGHRAIVPTFSTPAGQSLATWREEFRKQVKQVTADTVLVGHSLGAAFMLDILELVDDRVRGSFFVSGFLGMLGNPEFDIVNSTFVSRTFDWLKIRKAMGVAFLYHGDDDPYVPQSKALELAKQLGIAPQFIPGGGHLNTGSGSTKFDRLWNDLRPVLDR